MKIQLALWSMMCCGFAVPLLALGLQSGSIHLFLLLILILVATASVQYARIYRRLRNRGSLWSNVAKVLAYTPTSKASWHITAGTAIVTASSLGIGYGYAALVGPDDTAWWGYVTTASGMVMGSLTLILSFWTLNQTKTLEQMQGETFHRFDFLIEELIKEVQALTSSYGSDIGRGRDQYRIYLVSNNPLFGSISYRHSALTSRFAQAFLAAAAFVRLARAAGNTVSEAIQMRVLCADHKRLLEFNRSCVTAAEEAVADEITARSDSFIDMIAGDLYDRYRGESVLRVPLLIAEMQFVIVGDIVFEFILERPDPTIAGSRSKVLYGRRTEEPDYAEKYAQYFEFLWKLAGADAAHPCERWPEKDAAPTADHIGKPK